MPNPSIIERDGQPAIDLAAIRAANEQRRQRKEATIGPPWHDDGYRIHTPCTCGDPTSGKGCSGPVFAEYKYSDVGGYAEGEFIVAARSDPVEDVVDGLCAEVEFLSTVRQNLLAERNAEAMAAMKWKEETERLTKAVERMRTAIREHYSQKADDRCIEDDDRLYAAADLPPCDRRVGSKMEMLQNCARFIERRCEGGGWPTYRQLEAERDRLRAALQSIAQHSPAYESRREAEAALDGSNPSGARQ